MNRKQTCCFIGHRPQRLSFGSNEQHPDCVRLKAMIREEIEHLIVEEGVTHFISGMSVGTDLIAAEIVLELKKIHPSITLEAAIPYEEQAARWTVAQRDKYFSIAAQCDVENMLQTQYTPDCFIKCNQYMVKKSAYVIAVWDEKPSRTGQSVMMAREKGRHLMLINPMTWEVTRFNELNTAQS